MAVSLKQLGLVTNNEAQSLCQRALEGYEELHGPKHPNTLSTVEGMINILYQQGRLDEANELKLKYNI